MKKSCRIILLVLALLVFTLAAVSCGGETVESISIEDMGKLQTTYVKGQELNLSGAKLCVMTPEGESEISLDSEGVTVSGYDRNTLGKQTVKVEYGGASTEFTVTVVERIVVNGALTDYLVGDSFDKSKGAIKVTDDKGVSHSLELSSPSVSVSGFDSAVAKEGLEIRIIASVDGERYDGTFTVNIYAVESIDFHEPNKVTYGSHYVGLPDASGGRFVIKGNSGKIRREVAISADMISGFDISAVSAENPSVTQTLTVNYKGKSYEYEVQLTYTDVSMFLDSKDTFAAIDWNGASLPLIEDSTGELSLRLMNAYVDMPRSERALIDEDTVFAVARTAMVYGFNLWAENITLFEGVFAIEGGECVLYLESYDKVKSSLSLFEDKDSAIYSVAPLLNEIIELYGDRIVYENENTVIFFESYPVMDDYEISIMEAMLLHTVEIYELINTIDADWRGESLSAYYDTLREMTVKILGETYVSSYPGIYYLVSEWREGADLFDVLYAYLYETSQTEIMGILTSYGLPTSIYALYEHILSAALAMEDLSAAKELDTTRLLYNYYRANDIAALLRDGEGAESYLYDSIPINKLLGMDPTVFVGFEDMLGYIRASVLELTEGVIEVKEYDEVIRAYVLLIQNTVEIEGFGDSDAYGEGVKNIFDLFVNLSPEEQYNLIATFNMLYRSGIPELSFDSSDEYSAYASLFNSVINSFMRSKLSEEYAYAYDNLILAIEVYANRFNYVGWESDFTSRMDKVKEAMSLMVGDDSTNFNRYLGDAYAKYSYLRDNINAKTELLEWEDDFEALYKALRDMQTASYHISTSELPNYTYFLSSYETASLIIKNILENAPDEIVRAYYYEPLFSAYSDESGKEVYWTCEYALYAYRNVYMNTLLVFGEGDVNIYDAYFEYGIDEFLTVYYGMLTAFLEKTEGQSPIFDRDVVLSVLYAYSALDAKAKALFLTLEGGVDMYGSAREAFIEESFTEGAGALAEKLFILEAALLNYRVSESGVTLNSVKEILAEIKTDYAALSEEDIASFEIVYEIYCYYVEECEALFV